MAERRGQAATPGRHPEVTQLSFFAEVAGETFG